MYTFPLLLQPSELAEDPEAKTASRTCSPPSSRWRIRVVPSEKSSRQPFHYYVNFWPLTKPLEKKLTRLRVSARFSDVLGRKLSRNLEGFSLYVLRFLRGLASCPQLCPQKGAPDVVLVRCIQCFVNLLTLDAANQNQAVG